MNVFLGSLDGIPTQPIDEIEELRAGKLFIQIHSQMEMYESDVYEKILPLKDLMNSSGLILYYLNRDSTFLSLRQESIYSKTYVKIPSAPSSDLAGVVAYEKKAYLIEDTVKFNRTHQHIKLNMEVLKNCIYCFPVLNSKSETLCVIEMYRNDGGAFSELDCEYLLEFAKWFGITIEQYRKGVLQQNTTLIDRIFINQLFRYFSKQLNTFSDYLCEIFKYCQNVILPQNLFYYDMLPTDSKVPVAKLIVLQNSRLKVIVPRLNFIKISRYIVYMIKNNVEILNVKITPENRYLLSKVILSYSEAEEPLYNMLCISVISEKKILGIMCMTNSKRCKSFTQADEIFSKTLAQYIIPAFCDRKIAEELQIELANRECTKGTLKYQLCKMLIISNECHTETSIPHNFFELSWYPPLSSEQLLSFTYLLFTDICPNFFVKRTLKAFLLPIKNFHRNLSYHNFTQTFLQIHTLYLLIKQSAVLELSVEETIAMMLYSLTKYINYFGLDNETIHLLNHPLRQMVNKFYIENNALSLCLIIIERTKFLDHLPKEVSHKIIKLLSRHFLDSSNYYFSVYKNKLEKFIENNRLNMFELTQRNYIKNLLLWCSMNYRYLLPFGISNKLTQNFYKESYAIGDIQRKFNLKKNIGEMYDREFFKKIPELECNNIESTVLPMFKLLARIIPECGEIVELCSTLKQAYQIQLSLKDKKTWLVDDSYDALPEFDDIDAGISEEWDLGDINHLI